VLSGSRAPSGSRCLVDTPHVEITTKIIIPGPRMSVSRVGKRARGLLASWL
jgi:hypothetical protein